MTSAAYLDRARYPTEGNDVALIVSAATVARWFTNMRSLRTGLLYDLTRVVRGMRSGA